MAPIPTRLARPYSLPFYRFLFEGPLLNPGESSLNLNFEAANSFTVLPSLKHPILEEIIESDEVTLRYRSRLKSGWEWGIQLPIGQLGSGFMDPVITWYHRVVLHLTDDRNQVPFGEHIVKGPNEPTSEGGTGIGDLAATLSYPIGPRTRGSLALKLPTGNPNGMLGSGGVDFGFEIEHFIPINRRWGFSAQLAEIRQGPSTFLRDSRPWAYQASGALTWKPNRKESWTVQLQRESSALNTQGPISDQIQTTTSVAYQRNLGKGRLLTLYFSEDFDVLNPNLPVGVGIGPDFTIGANLTIRF